MSSVDAMTKVLQQKALQQLQADRTLGQHLMVLLEQNGLFSDLYERRFITTADNEGEDRTICT